MEMGCYWAGTGAIMRLETPAECRREARIELPRLLRYETWTDEHGTWKESLWDRGDTLPWLCRSELYRAPSLGDLYFNVRIDL